jgi:outer membrane lipoprotein SlyB
MKIFALLLLSLMMIQGCASSLKGDVYSRNEAQKTMNFRWGTIESTKPVVIQGDRSEKGLLAGGLIGGLAGSGVTNSSTQGLVTVVGAVAGAVAGQMAEEKMTRAQGLEITLKMDDGQEIVIVQEVEKVDEFASGDHVKVISDDGKMRVAH